MGWMLRNRRCLYTGDLLCGTEADPNMLDHGEINHITLQWECTGSAYCIDQYGETYHPDIYNLMAYGNTMHANKFSTDQVSVMQFKAMKMGYFSNNTQFDIYEPDDNIEMARNFNYFFGLQQTHTFHNRAIGESYLQDEDWFQFVIPQGQTSGVIELFTESAGEEHDADTEIALFKDGQIIKYDDNSNGNGFSYLQCSGLTEGTYTFRVSFKNYSFLYSTYSYKISYTNCVSSYVCIYDKTVASGETYNFAATDLLEAPCKLNTPGTFIIKPNATSHFKSSNEIHLNEGFHAEAGSYFHAEITDNIDCNDNDAKMNINTVAELNPVQNAETNEIESEIEKEIILCSDVQFTISPNPTSGRFILNFATPTYPKYCEILDLTGTVRQTVSIYQSQTDIDIKALPSGIYLLKINIEGKNTARKIVLQKE
jgi:hypothetical protein